MESELPLSDFELALWQHVYIDSACKPSEDPAANARAAVLRFRGLPAFPEFDPNAPFGDPGVQDRRLTNIEAMRIWVREAPMREGARMMASRERLVSR